MIKALVFDLGGVILDLDRKRCLDAFHSIGFDGIDAMLDTAHQKGAMGEMERGALSEEDFIADILSSSRPGTTADDVRKAVLSLILGVESYKFDLLRELSGKYPLYLLSNSNPIVYAWWEKYAAEHGLPLDKYFKKMYFSHIMGCLKPDAEIYRRMLSDIAYAPSELLFIDDAPSNVEGGRRSGMNTLLYTVGSDLRSLILSRLEDLL